jgi:transcriptional regulator
MKRVEFLQGTLDMLILRTLSLGPRHGYGIAQVLKQTTESAIQIDAGSLYPALQRLELQELVSAEWATTERNQRTRVYQLTPAGRQRLHDEVSRWENFVQAVSMVLHPKPTEGGTGE